MKPEEAKKLFNKIKNNWGISTVGIPIAHKCKGIVKGDLFHPCHWMGKLKTGYRRPTFKEFLKLYEISLDR